MNVLIVEASLHIFRKLYWEKLAPFVDKPVIKVICGMRRVGKSYFLRQIISEIETRGVCSENIIHVDMEDMELAHISDAGALHRYVQAGIEKLEGKVYLLVDEIQEIGDWEKAIASFHKKERVDCYITGSNAHLLSSDLATLIAGRYVEIPVYPLGFSEFRLFLGEARGSIEEDFRAFLRLGGMPAIFHFEQTEEIVYQYDSAIFNTILLKDIIQRHHVRNASLLERVAAYLFDNVGQLVSANSISRFLKSQKIRAYPDTIAEYLGYFTAAFAAHRVPRYDIKGKRLLEINDKYYANDLGMRHAVLGYRNADISQMLENLVYLELRRRGYDVSVGKTGDLEVDFIATKNDQTIYLQVAYLLESEKTRDRELRPLLAIKDNYPKAVLSMDPLSVDNIKGIKLRNLLDFLLDENILTSV
jgi:predicted AAA+ superfamily ATPase